MHNLSANFGKFLDICNKFGKKFTNENQVGKTDFEKVPSIGYCASQSKYYLGYKLHILCGIRGVVHSFDLTKAEVADIHYLQNIKTQVSDCNILGDKGYLSCDVQIDLFQTANIRLEVPKKIKRITNRYFLC